MIWTIVNTIATLISTVAFVLTALYVRAEMKAVEKDRYLSVTNDLFAIWQSREFMESQLWLLHQLDVTTWEGFVEKHRGDVGEAAFHRVGSFYDRVGTLARMNLIDEQEVLSTFGAYVIAVWQKMGPLVLEARRIENSTLFDDFEALLPACHECYVPALGKDGEVNPFSLRQERAPQRGHAIKLVDKTNRISREELQRLLKKQTPLTLLDVRNANQIAKSPQMLPGARHILLDELPQRYSELPITQEAIVYCA